MLNKDYAVAEKLLKMDPLPAGTELDEDNETVQKYLYSLLQGISELSDKKWDKLPESVQGWFNDGAKLAGELDENMGLVLPVPEELEVEELEVEELEVEELEVEEPEAKKEKKAKPEAKPEKKPKHTKKVPTSQVIRELVCENVDITILQVMETLEERGIKSALNSAKIVWLNSVKAFEVAHKEGGVMKEDKDYLQAVEYED